MFDQVLERTVNLGVPSRAHSPISRVFFLEPVLMRRIALVSLTMLSGCGYHTWWNPPFSTGYSPNTPVTNSENMSRVKGEGVAVTPLTTEPGDIWPGPLAPPKTLQDLERQSPGGAQAPTVGSPAGRAGSPLLAPLPNAAPGATTDPTHGGYPTMTPPASSQPQADRRIIVPNGNGTSTVIHPDGRIETIPTPK
jgi:hypothetical protein